MSARASLSFAWILFAWIPLFGWIPWVLADPARASASTPRRVADLETEVDATGSSSPLVQARLEGWLYFSAADPLHGEELWRTDGSPAGTELVADLCPGRCSSRPRHLAAAGGRLLLSAEVGLLGREPWASDGTRAGTVALGDLCPGSCSSVVESAGLWPAALGDSILFAARDPAAGAELWRTDGTPAGTARLADLWAGPAGSDPQTLVAFDGLVYFGAAEPAHGRELWASDGTPEGTRLVRDFAKGTFGSGARVLGGLDERLLVREGSVIATNLWVVERRGRLRPLGNFPCHSDCSLLEAARVGDWMLVSRSASSRRPAPSLWRTDLTAEGTELLANFDGGLAHELTAAGGRAFFHANSGELWTTDGTADGTRLVRRFERSRAGTVLGPVGLTALGESVVFGAWSESQGFEPWASDGSDAGTRLLQDVVPGPGSSLAFYYEPIPARFAALDGRVLFAAATPENGRELWMTDGTPPGTALLADLHRDPGSSRPAGLTAWNGRLVFSAFQSASGFDPWETDGSVAGTARWRDLPDQGHPSPEFVAFEEHLYFASADPPAADQLWRSDGTPGGTLPIPGGDGDARALTPAGSRLFLLATPAGHPCFLADCAELVELPAGSSSVALVKDINPGFYSAPLWPDSAAGSDAHDLTALGDQLVLAADDGVHGSEPWISDGTPAGTQLLADLCPGYCTSAPRDFAAFGGWVLFVAGDSLWRTDGTAAGTIALRAFAPPAPGLAPRELVSTGARLFFLAGTAAGDELWTTDGTAAGTGRVSDLAGDGSPAWARRLTAAGGRLFLAVHHGTTGEELWSSDGTPAGTRLVADLAPGTASSAPEALTAVDGLLLFAADDGTTGMEPWVSDGTAAGTYPLADLAPGAAASSPDEFTRSGDLVFWSAADAERGRELWAVEAAALATPRCRTSSTELCLQDGRFAVRVRWATPAQSGPGHAVARTPETGLFWFFSPGNPELIVKMIDGGEVNGHHWFFYNSLSDVEYDIEVEEVASGARRAYRHAPGDLCGRADTAAFPAAAARGDRLVDPGEDPRGGAAAAPRAAGACVPGPTTLCLRDGRFAVGTSFADPRRGGAPSPAPAIPGGDESGFFAFFGEQNFELGVKILDGTPVNGKHWLFHAALTDVEYTLTAVDTSTGEVRAYRHAPGRLCGGADTAAF
jgi:ELWxxDGT repeat protein